MAGSRFKNLSRGLNRVRGERNKTEAEYELILVDSRDNETPLEGFDSHVVNWWFEPVTMRLSHPPEGQPARFSVDFMILLADGTTLMDEVKGSGGFEDPAAIVRLKCAAEQFSLWIFRRVQKKRKKDGGGWKITQV